MEKIEEVSLVLKKHSTKVDISHHHIFSLNLDFKLLLSLTEIYFSARFFLSVEDDKSLSPISIMLEMLSKTKTIKLKHKPEVREYRLHLRQQL